MGRAAQKSGSIFETMLELTHIRYKDSGLAWVEKNHVPCKPFFMGGKSVWRPVGKALPDYGGWLLGGGSVLFEAKSSKVKTRWPFPKDRAHQYMMVLLARKFGVLSGYLLFWQEFDEVRWYDANTLPAWGDKLEREMGVLVPTVNGYVEWLPVIKGEDGEHSHREILAASQGR